MSFEDCISRELIKKEVNSKNRIEKEILIANKFLISAKNIIKIKEYDSAILASYNSCFHFLRALLYKQGYVEKSHYCLVEALRVLYKKEKELPMLLNDFDKIRMTRHEIQYRGEFAEENEAKYIISFNEKLKINVEKILKN